MSSVPIIISIVSLCVSVLALWRTRSSLSLYQESDGTIQVTNDSQHTVTLVELGMVTSDGSFKSFYFREDGPVLPHRLEARDIISFHPSIAMTIELEHEKQTRGRSGCFARMASGQFFGKKGRICSEVSLVKRLYWRICSIAGR